MNERKAFEKMMKRLIRDYFVANAQDLARGLIFIEDDGHMLKIYKIDMFYRKIPTYDIGIVY